MLAAGLVASFAGLLVMAAVKPHATAAYFHAVFSTGGGDGSLLLFLNVLVLPNMATWVLSASMGGCLGVWASNVGICGISYAHFPAGLHLSAGAVQGLIAPGATLPQLPGAPAAYFAFLLVPAVAVLIGGGVAARRSGAQGAGEAAGVGALAGVLFSLVSTAAVVLTAITLGVTASVGFSESISAWAGADLGSTLLAALLWGVVGGVVGALALRRRVPTGAAASWTEPPAGRAPAPPPQAGPVPSTG